MVLYQIASCMHAYYFCYYFVVHVLFRTKEKLIELNATMELFSVLITVAVASSQPPAATEHLKCG